MIDLFAIFLSDFFFFLFLRLFTRIGELEKQVDKLRKELESQSQEKDSVEIRAYVAEKKKQRA